MNNGLPSLLDAIFGKQNLDSVSLDEIYELINEFPSFNAGHFLLSKKLKGQNETGYESETKRTALYFNNPFWLESALTEEPGLISGRINSEPNVTDTPVGEFLSQPEPMFDDQSYSVSSIAIPQSYDEQTDLENIIELQQTPQEESPPEHTERPVTSFDDLISKYHIETISTGEENLVEPRQNILEPVIDESQSVEKADYQQSDIIANDQELQEIRPESDSDDFDKDEIAENYEIREEVVNDYGIFEEVKVKKKDFDLEAFDPPVTNVQDHVPKPQDSIPAEQEDPVPVEPFKELSQDDYDAFDRPIVQQDPEENEPPAELKEDAESISEIYSGQEERLESVESRIREDDRSASEMSSQEPDSGTEEIPALAARFEEQQKMVSRFDPKKAESIMFAPYHMIDYFASQGIKLILEENPVDPLAKQLKSFTDWLKVMKKLPVQSLTEKTDEKDVDRVRHFAAHSIDEREILTESMAEVLAKQGMYENAIALFQKLSLIYPPKSAYFATRIEQLKAFLP